jgi:hypothetical protein
MPTIDRICTLYDTDFEIEFMKATVRIYYDHEKASGNGWDEPREDASVSFCSAERIDVTPHEPITKGPLLTWARKTFDYESDDLLGDDGPDPDEARDRQFEFAWEARA